jgi:hypothetical protein
MQQRDEARALLRELAGICPGTSLQPRIDAALGDAPGDDVNDETFDVAEADTRPDDSDRRGEDGAWVERSAE